MSESLKNHKRQRRSVRPILAISLTVKTLRNTSTTQLWIAGNKYQKRTQFKPRIPRFVLKYIFSVSIVSVPSIDTKNRILRFPYSNLWKEDEKDFNENRTCLTVLDRSLNKHPSTSTNLRTTPCLELLKYPPWPATNLRRPTPSLQVTRSVEPNEMFKDPWRTPSTRYGAVS